MTYLYSVGKKLQGEQEGESLVRVPEDGGVPDPIDQKSQGVVDKLRTDWPPGILLLQVVSDLRGWVMVRGLGCCAGSVDGPTRQEVEYYEAVLVRDQPVQVSLPNPV